MAHYEISGKVELFPQEAGWHYVKVPRKLTAETRDIADRGLVAVTAELGGSRWNTSLMPFGDGTQFVPLSKKVRAAEGVELGDRVKLRLTLRSRT